MPRRNDNQKVKRNATRRENTTRNRKAVFCLKHLEITNPEILNKTMEIFEFVNSIYPNKHDLTKTTLYRKTIENQKLDLRIGNHNVPISRSTATTDPTNNFEVIPVLNIPLIERPRSNHQADIEIPFVEGLQQDIEIPFVEEPQQDIEIPFVEEPQQNLHDLPQDLHELPQDLHELPQDLHELSQDLQGLSQDLRDVILCDELGSIMDELTQDPDLQDFFAEIEVPNDGSQAKTVEEEIDNIIKEEFRRMDAQFKTLVDY